MIHLRFGRLMVIALADIGERGEEWLCICDCGRRAVVRADLLRSGNTRSCGCLRRDLAVVLNTKHGLANDPIYRVWSAMWQRCTNPKDKSWANYGGRGISVDLRWRDAGTFAADMGERPPGASLDRIDNDGNYEPGNCRWATRREQMSNTRRSVLLTDGERVQTLSAWARDLGLDTGTLNDRRRRGTSGLSEVVS